MGWLITSIPFFLYALNILRWDYTDNSPTAEFVAFVIGCACLYPFLRDRLSPLFLSLRQDLKSNSLYAAEKRRESAIAREWETSDFILPTPEQFRELIASRATTGDLHYLFLMHILTCQQRLYERSGLTRKGLPVKRTKHLYNLFLQSCVEGLNRVARVLPFKERFLPTPFTTQINYQPDTIAPLYGSLAEPMNNEELKALFSDHSFTISDPPDNPGTIKDRYRSYLNDEEPPAPEKVKREWERDKKEYDKKVAAARQSLTPMQLALEHTPYWLYQNYLIPDEPIEEPFLLPYDARFSGTWIVAPPARGKTTLLHNLINEDRKQHCTIVLMDSKGDLINGYRGLPDVVVIDPATANINPLQLGSSTRSVEFLEYIFSALLDTAMTALQKTLFRSVLTLLLKVPNATLETFRQVLTHGIEPYTQYLSECDPGTRDFFTVGKPTEFNSPTYKETKQQILWRLRLILSNEYLRNIFTAPRTNVPFSALLDSAKLIIIDNSKDDLGEDGAEFFGRFFVALTWMAAVSRSRLRLEDKVPVYFYIDECQSVIKRDDKIATILDECRSQKIALILAHQRIGQIISPNVLDALGNCAIRMANSDDDAAQLAPRFRVDPQALRLPRGKFAAFVRDMTPQAVAIDVPLVTMEISAPPRKAPPEPLETIAEESITELAINKRISKDGVEDF